jgi:hypothetical protein
MCTIGMEPGEVWGSGSGSPDGSRRRENGVGRWWAARALREWRRATGRQAVRAASGDQAASVGRAARGVGRRRTDRPWLTRGGARGRRRRGKFWQPASVKVQNHPIKV